MDALLQKDVPDVGTWATLSLDKFGDMVIESCLRRHAQAKTIEHTSFFAVMFMVSVSDMIHRELSDKGHTKLSLELRMKARRLEERKSVSSLTQTNLPTDINRLIHDYDAPYTDPDLQVLVHTRQKHRRRLEKPTSPSSWDDLSFRNNSNCES